ncbi:hypothetical protein BJ166DRAFT_526011 [Pestalotiopsis sp. NC0098]|nr:hypothetical protein BJ166DRAFT_526011 [Pestalotiopsis sp. NC0098]
MHGEAQNSGRTTSMRLHQMILANFIAKGGLPTNLANIAFTEITNSAVQEAINRDYRDLCEMDNVPPTSEVITFAPHYFTDWQARVNRNPFLKCVVHVLEEVNRRNPGLNHQIREVRYSAVDDWTNVDYGYHMGVSIGPSNELAPIRPAEPERRQRVPAYYGQGYGYDQYQGGYSQSSSYGGGYNVATQDYSQVNIGRWYT